MKKISFLILIILAGCQPQSDKEIAADPYAIRNLAWLQGSWKMMNKDGAMFENWKKVNDDLLRGHSFVLSGTDTVFSETIELVQKGNELFYNVTVRDQNEGKAISFKFTEVMQGEYVFENPLHDFPQRIIYKHPQPDFLCARIEGFVDGKNRKEDFNFVKVK